MVKARVERKKSVRDRFLTEKVTQSTAILRLMRISIFWNSLEREKTRQLYRR